MRRVSWAWRLILLGSLFYLETVTFLTPRVSRTGLSSRSTRSALRAKAAYPELSNLEDRIYESCIVKDFDEELDCMDVYSNLVETHFQAQKECDADSSKCALLKVLDRLAWGTKGTDALMLLQQLRESVEAIYQMHQSHWNDAFESLDEDKDGRLSEREFRAGLRRLNPGISEETSGRIFRAADVNLDGVIDAEEFADFLKAGAIAGEPLKKLTPQSVSAHRKSSEALLLWAMHGNMHSDGREDREEHVLPVPELKDLTR